MTSALVYNNSVEAFYSGDVPGRIFFKNGGTVDGATVGYSNANGYSILPATYTDTPPLPQSYSTGNSYVISNGTVNVTRTWVTPTQTPIAVQVNSVSMPALNGPYSITPQAIKAYSAVASQVQASSAFPNGATAFVLNDANAIPHSFTTSAFMAFYNAVTYYSTAGQAPQTLTIL